LTSTPQVTVRISPLVYMQNFTPSLPQGPNSLQLPSLFGYGPQMAQENEIQELLACTAAPALDAEPPSSSDGTGT